MHRLVSCFLAALALCCASVSLGAQSFQPKNIVFNGAPAYTSEELLAAAGLKKGAAVTAAELKEHLQRLNDTGVFQNVSYKFDGVSLIYMLSPADNMLPVHLENLPLATGKDLDAKLHDRLPLFHGKVPLEGSLLDGVCRALEEMLAAQGIKATVTAEPLSAMGSSKMSAMNLTIADPPVLVGAINLEGVSPAMQSKIDLVAVHATGAPFFTDGSAQNLVHAFESFYGDEGYAKVKVHAIQSGDPVAGGKGIEVPFHVIIEEGRHYSLGAIRLPSGEAVTQAEVEKAAGIVSNKLEKLSLKDGVTFRTALLFVHTQYKSKGYMACVVTPHPEFDETNGVVNYNLEVNPGPVYTMGKLTITNIADDLRQAMLAAWKLAPGDIFDESAIQAYFHNQGNTALGRTFASTLCRYKLARNDDTHTVDVTLQVERKP
jgi:outer membrane protein assembly factor BamA